MESFRREMKRGTIELILLKLLDSEEMYGYQIVATLEKRGGELFQVKEGTLYPVLYRLEDGGFIESYRDNPKRGVPRKYYKLTEKGKAQLEALLKEWTHFLSAMDKLIYRKENENE